MTSTIARQKKEQEWTLKAVLSSIPSGVICTDTQWMVTQINPTAEVLTGVLCSEGIGKPLEKCLRIIDRKSKKSIDKLIAKSRLEPVNWELDNLVLLDRDRHEIPIRFKVTPIENDRDIIIGFAIVLDRLVDREHQELVQHKPTEIELQRLNLELETRAQQRSEDFLAANSQLVIALEEKGRIESQLRRHLERLKLTYQMAFDLDRASTLEQVYQVAIASIKQIFQADRAAISIQDENGHLRFQMSDGLSQEFIEIAEEFCIQSFCANNIEPTIVSDIETFAKFDPIRDAIRAEGFKSVGMFVLSYQERTFGEICFSYNRTHNFSEEEVQLCKAIAAYIAMAISRKQAKDDLEESEEKYRILFNAIEDSVFVHPQSASSNFLAVNDSACRGLGYTRAELLAMSPRDIIPPYFHTNCPKATKSPDGKHFMFEIIHLRKDGTEFPVEVAGMNFEFKGEQMVMGIARNISDRKQAEKLRLELEREKEINELRIRFFSMMSHEFRTPLAVIINATHLVKLANDRIENKSIQKQVNYIESSTKRLVSIMDHVLTINRAEVGKLEFNPQPLQVDRYCRQIVTEMTLSIGNQQRIHYHNHCQIQKGNLDRRLLDSILSNLLSNALKYSPENTTVTLELDCQAAPSIAEPKKAQTDRQTDRKRSKTHNETAASKHIVFQISDRGIGIPESDLKHIFDPFYRAKNAEKLEGTGLGLSIVKQYVKAHGGTITVKSEIGVGTTFTVTLPF